MPLAPFKFDTAKKMPHGSRKILTQRPKAGRKASKEEGKVLVFKS